MSGLPTRRSSTSPGRALGLRPAPRVHGNAADFLETQPPVDGVARLGGAEHGDALSKLAPTLSAA